MMIAITAGFLFLSAVHSSHVVKLQYSRNGASTFSSVSVTTVAGQLLRDLSSESLSPILKRRTQSLTDPTSMALSPYTHLRHVWILMGLEPSRVRNSVISLYPVRTSTIPAIYHPSCVERKWLTGASMIPLELDSVLNGGCGKKFCPAAHLKKDGIKFILTFICIS